MLIATNSKKVLLKRLGIAVLCIILLGSLLQGCTKFSAFEKDKKKAYTAEEIIELFPSLTRTYEGIHLVISNATPRGINIYLADWQDSNVELLPGFFMFVLEKDNWASVELNENIGFLRSPVGLTSDKNRGYINFEFYYGELKPGAYRFIQGLLLLDLDVDLRLQSIVYLYVDFVIND